LADVARLCARLCPPRVLPERGLSRGFGKGLEERLQVAGYWFWGAEEGRR
jgi:hypothetical protein